MEIVTAPNPEILTVASQWPLALEDAKRFLRLEHTNDEDADILDLIKAASEYIRSRTETTLILTDYVSTWEAFPSSGCFDLPYPPVTDAEITYYDQSGTLKTMSTGWQLINTGSTRSQIVLDASSSWPATDLRADAVQINYTAGYGATAADVPAQVRHAMRLLVRQWYDERRAASAGGSKALEFSLDSLLSSLSSGRVY